MDGWLGWTGGTLCAAHRGKGTYCTPAGTSTPGSRSHHAKPPEPQVPGRPREKEAERPGAVFRGASAGLTKTGAMHRGAPTHARLAGRAQCSFGADGAGADSRTGTPHRAVLSVCVWEGDGRVKDALASTRPVCSLFGTN